ncbi:MAG: sensor histidine kinase [Gammaproteobacteria bacterium]|nr:MAG: sensor histidine kinase [Gammaproteobacteria bacterium]
MQLSQNRDEFVTENTGEVQRSSRLLFAITHDLAQPLHAARLFSSALEGRISDPKQQQMVDNIHASLEIAEQMLTEISLLGKLDAQSLPVEIEQVKVQEVIFDVISGYSPQVQSQDNQIKYMPTKAVVQTDKVMLRRVLQRLVSNSLRFTKNGKILIGCRRFGDKLLLQVWDNGIGMDCSDEKDIFEEFIRLRNHDLYDQRCFGLGLAIVKRICSQIGAEISFRSWSGNGSVFSVHLPCQGR